MAYTTASEMAALLPFPITASTNPNLTELATLCDEISARVDAAAAHAGYAVPITAPAAGGATTAYLTVADITKQGVGYHALRRAFPNLSQGTGADKVSIATDYRDQYVQALKELRDGKLPLVGAGSDPTDTGRVLPRGRVVSRATALSVDLWNREF